MKKLFLLIALGASIGTVSKAQSVVFINKAAIEKPQQEIEQTPSELKLLTSRNAANKGTAGGSDWFYYASLMTSTASRYYYNVVYQDSNVVYPGTSGNVNVFNYGMGFSFDPTDSSYFGGDKDGKTSAGPIQDFNALPGFRVFSDKSYTIDSISFACKYYKPSSNNDTLYIQIAKFAKSGSTQPFGFYSLQYSNQFDVSPDGTPGFGTVLADKNTNRFSDSISSSNYIQIKKVLDQAFANDTFTNAGGRSRWTGNGIALPTPLTVSANEIVVAHVSFRSSVNHPLGTPSSTANHIRLYSFDVAGNGGSPKQNVGSSNTGLVFTRQQKYGPNQIYFQGHLHLLPNVGYNSDGYTTDMAFKVTCANCPTLNVANINRDLTGVSAYPNPANTDVTITYTLKNAAKANISITNTVGQVVATQAAPATTNGKVVISTSNLTNGIYFYTVEANGERTTNRFVVAH